MPSPSASLHPGRSIARRTVRTAGGDIEVQEWGNPAGEPVVMIHGTTSHAAEFVVSLGPTLGSDYRLIAYDRPGMGRSMQRPSDAERLAVQAKTAADIIAALKLEHPVVIGHSYGGAVALRLGLDYPELVSGLVLLSPVGHPWHGGAPFPFPLLAAPVAGEIFAAMLWPLSKSLVKAFLKHAVFAPAPMPVDYYECAEVRIDMQPRQLRASAKDFAALPAELRLQATRYSELAMPISVIVGKDDRIIPADTIKAIQALPGVLANAHLILLPGVGHAPQHARPDLVKSEIAWVFGEAGR